MKKRKLGNSGLQVFPLCFGGNVFGWTASEERSFELLDAFVDAGFNFIDTADVYSKWAPGNRGGESETIIGKWLKRSGKRQEVIIATKVGMELAPDKKGLSKDYILRAAEDSLSRLQTDYIDLYQSHQDDPRTPIEETLAAFGELIQAGKVRVIGASNYTAERLTQTFTIAEGKNLPQYDSLQPLYNLYDREGYEQKLERVCEARGLGVIPYYSLASGFLTGKYRSAQDVQGASRAARVKTYLNERGFRILKALDQVAKEYRSTPGKAALAWLLTRRSVTAPIASATTLEQLRELTEGANMDLDAEAADFLTKASAYARTA